MNIPLSTDRTLAQTAAFYPRCISNCIHTAYRHVPYASAQRSYIQLAKPHKIVQNNRHFPLGKTRTPIQMPFKLCSVIRRRCESSLFTYAPHRGSVYSLLRRYFDSALSTALLRLELLVSLFSLCRASCLISVSKPVAYTSMIIQLLNHSLDNLYNNTCS